MEMEYHDTSRRGRLLIILGVVLAVAAGAAANLLGAWLAAPDHRSLGASTAVFAAVAMLAAFTWRRGYWRHAIVSGGATQGDPRTECTVIKQGIWILMRKSIRWHCNWAEANQKTSQRVQKWVSSGAMTRSISMSVAPRTACSRAASARR